MVREREILDRFTEGSCLEVFHERVIARACPVHGITRLTWYEVGNFPSRCCKRCRFSLLCISSHAPKGRWSSFSNMILNIYICSGCGKAVYFE